MKTVLVTGGAGFVGSHACKALARAGYLPVTQRYRFDAEEPQTLRVSLAKKPEAAQKPAVKTTTPPPPTSGWASAPPT